MKHFVTQLAITMAVLLGIAALGAMVQSGDYMMQIERLQNPSNSEVEPLENAGLGWFVFAPIMMIGALFFAGIGGRRLVHRRSLLISLAIWTVALIWLSASAAMVGGLGLGRAFSTFTWWFVIPPLLIALFSYTLVSLERQPSK